MKSDAAAPNKIRPPKRRDIVGRSGVYPMSGPMPPGDAPLRGQMEWGQGRRGSGGYADHGGSELALYSGVLVGGGAQPWSGAEEETHPAGAHCHEIAVAEWPAFCAWFTTSFRGIELTAKDSGGIQFRNRPLRFISAHLLENMVDAITVAVKTGSRVRRMNITGARHLRMFCNAAGSPTEIRIETTGDEVALHFKGGTTLAKK